MQKLILATTSPYRIKAFGELGIPFTALGSDVDERFEGRPDNPSDLVLSLSCLKAESVARRIGAPCVVIGFDSVGWHDGRILEKPQSCVEAFERLYSLSGDSHHFYTGIHVIDSENQKRFSRVAVTEIAMRKLTEGEISRYLAQDQNYNTYALGYDPLNHLSSTFASRISGSYNNFLRGIPTEVIVEMLRDDVGMEF